MAGQGSGAPDGAAAMEGGRNIGGLTTGGAGASAGLAGRARRAADEIAGVIGGVDPAEVDALVAALAGAKRIAVYGVGREGLQLRGFAMRLFHLGLAASVVGDMNCPSVGPGDLLLVSAGPGSFSTVAALIAVARGAGARTGVVTARTDSDCARVADLSLIVPAQTMADDREAPTSILPMGSLYEGALHVLFELLVLALREQLGVTADAMRERHTNLE